MNTKNRVIATAILYVSFATCWAQTTTNDIWSKLDRIYQTNNAISRRSLGQKKAKPLIRCQDFLKVIERNYFRTDSAPQVELEDFWMVYGFGVRAAQHDLAECLKEFQSRATDGLLELRSPEKTEKVELRKIRTWLASQFKKAAKLSIYFNKNPYELFMSLAIASDTNYTPAIWNLGLYYSQFGFWSLLYQEFLNAYRFESDKNWIEVTEYALFDYFYQQPCFSESIRSRYHQALEDSKKQFPNDVEFKSNMLVTIANFKNNTDVLAEVNGASTASCVQRSLASEEINFNIFKSFEEVFFSDDCKIQEDPLWNKKYTVESKEGIHGYTLYMKISQFKLRKIEHDSMEFGVRLATFDSVRNDDARPEDVKNVVFSVPLNLAGKGRSIPKKNLKAICDHYVKAFEPYLGQQRR